MQMNTLQIAHRKYKNGNIITTYYDGTVTVAYRDGTVNLIEKVNNAIRKS